LYQGGAVVKKTSKEKIEQSESSEEEEFGVCYLFW
jgi:hypothetical protein